MLNESISGLLTSISKTITDKTVRPYIIKCTQLLQELLKQRNAFIFPYKYYFLAKDKLDLLTPKEDWKVFKFPKFGYCSKEFGVEIYNRFLIYFSKYEIKKDDIVYLEGRVIDTFWVNQSLFDLDKHLKEADLENKTGITRDYIQFQT